MCSCHLPHGPASFPDWRESATLILVNFTTVPCVKLLSFTWSSIVSGQERISCCHSWLIYFRMLPCYLVLSCHPHIVEPRVWIRENQLLARVILLLFCYLMCNCHPPHGPALCPDLRESAAVTIWLIYCCFATWCAAVILHMVQPRVQTVENQLLSLPVIFLLFWYLVCSWNPPYGPASCLAGENQLLLFFFCFDTWCAAVILHMVQLLVIFLLFWYLVCSCNPPNGPASCPAGENQLLSLLVNFTTVCYLHCKVPFRNYQTCNNIL